MTDDGIAGKDRGIIQGMSGSPIIQNGKLIGAVTHVFVQDSTKGYGIFIENMLKEEESRKGSKRMSKYYCKIFLNTTKSWNIIHEWCNQDKRSQKKERRRWNI